VEIHKLIVYTIEEGGKVKIKFTDHNQETTVRETFEVESLHSIEMRHEGWQAILDNFKRYVESNFD
jgi:uncharacterized protein YndB with AHSA1/START domain